MRRALETFVGLKLSGSGSASSAPAVVSGSAWPASVSGVSGGGVVGGGDVGGGVVEGG